MTTRFRILYFAEARRAAGVESEELILDGSPSVRSVLEEAFRFHPSLSELRDGLRVAVNEQLVPETRTVKNGDRVALLPMVVGG